MGGLAALIRPRRRGSAAFAALNPAQLDSLLAAISKNEMRTRHTARTILRHDQAGGIRGYYTSEIGIHRELRYKGNQFLQEFVGCATEDGKDCPHCGQKA